MSRDGKKINELMVDAGTGQHQVRDTTHRYSILSFPLIVVFEWAHTKALF